MACCRLVWFEKKKKNTKKNCVALRLVSCSLFWFHWGLIRFLIPPGVYAFLVALGAYSLLLFNWGLIPFWFRWGIINLFVCTEGFLLICVAPVWIGSRKKRKTQKKLRRVAFGFMHSFLVPPGAHY
jgi:Flp pilus assembly protein TadB